MQPYDLLASAVLDGSGLYKSRKNHEINGENMKLKKIALTLAAASAVLAAGVFSVQAFARPAYAFEVAYYSDPGLTQHVGTTYFNCAGRKVIDGEVTQYSQVFGETRC